MHFDFEAAAISISIGVVVAVLLQGTLLDRADAEHVPPSVWRALQAFDLWLSVVFVLVVAVAIGAPAVALMHDRPLRIGDRRAVAHLLLVAGAYPALIAIARRMLPILHAPPQEEVGGGAPRLRLSVLLVPLLGLPVAIELVVMLLRRNARFGDSLLLIALAGLVIAGPAIAAEPLAAWRARRRVGRLPGDAAQRPSRRARSPAKPG